MNFQIPISLTKPRLFYSANSSWLPIIKAKDFRSLPLFDSSAPKPFRRSRQFAKCAITPSGLSRCSENLLLVFQDFFLIRENFIQRALVLLDCCLVLKNCLLIFQDGCLVAEEYFVVCCCFTVWHGPSFFLYCSLFITTRRPGSTSERSSFLSNFRSTDNRSDDLNALEW